MRLIVTIGCGVIALIATGCDKATMTSTSMTPTIASGERVKVDYSAYLISLPKRWDAVAFSPPGRSNETWVFRVVALPGERVDFASNGVAVNGRPLVLPRQLTNVAYVSLDEIRMPSAIESPCVVPADSYFLLGDNSRNANDSRFLGAIPRTNILGRVRGK